MHHPRILLARFLELASMGILVVLLSGCASPPYVTDTTLRERAKTSDSLEIERRFGALAQLGDETKALGYAKDGGGGVITGRWVVPGVHLTVSQLLCGGSGAGYFCNRWNWDWYYDPASKGLFWHCEVKDVDQSCKHSWYEAAVQPDGSVNVKPTSVAADPPYTIRLDSTSSRMIIGRGQWPIVERESAERVASGWQQQARSSQRAKDRESREFWDNVAQATLSAAQTVAAERANAPPAFVPSMTQSTAVQQRSANASTASSTHPATAVQSPAASSATAAQHAANGQASAAPVQRTAQQVAAGSTSAAPRGQTAQQATTASTSAAAQPVVQPERPKLMAYPEAVVVCTIPSGEQGRFTCDNPVNSVNGHKDIHPVEWRTPEGMIRSFSGSCRDARPLRSTTHKVWGCGFAATDKIVGYYDRVRPGVHVEGRRTFYCNEGQQGCRRTEP